MSENNSDVDRAIVAYGGVSFHYQSFGSYVGDFHSAVGFPDHVASDDYSAPSPRSSPPAVAPIAPLVTLPFYEALPEVPPPPMAWSVESAGSPFVTPATEAFAAKPTYAVTFPEHPIPESVLVPPRVVPASRAPSSDQTEGRSLSAMFRLLHRRDEDLSNAALVIPLPVPIPEITRESREAPEKPCLFRRI